MAAGSFGARACRAIRNRLLTQGAESLPKGWQRKWIIQRILATPPWVDMREVRKIYKRAGELTKQTGEQWTVGHQVPLNHPKVCGLHVPWNLAVERAVDNFSKGNFWIDGQQPIQHKLFFDLEHS